MGGTRFNARGVDDDGNCANFVETEMIVEYPSMSLMFSHVQVRGSLPLFWAQKVKGERVKIGNDAANAFDEHFQDLFSLYSIVTMLNLLSQTAKPQEDWLS